MATPANALIIGAGPTGLTAAMELARRGVHVRIFEKALQFPQESRALAINPRSLEILEPGGVTGTLLAEGIKIGGADFHTAQNVLAQLETGDIPHRFNFMLSLPQSRTQQILCDRLAQYGVEVEWGHEFRAASQDGRKARAELHAGSRTITAEADLLLGCDGAHSDVRDAIGANFAGGGFDTEWGLADVRADHDLPPGRIHIFDLAPLLFGVIPMPGGLLRFVADRPDALEAAPDRFKVTETVWTSQFRISHRLSDIYAKGRIYLAGDAAHIHSPLGGRGMNLGIEDAAWLAWLAVNDRLDRYEALRRPQARRVLKTVDGATHVMADDDRIKRTVRRSLIPAAAALPPLRKIILKRIAGLDSAQPEWL